MEFTRVEGALRCELPVLGKPHALAYFVPAEAAFTKEDERRTITEGKFRRLQYSLLEEELGRRPRRQLFIFLVLDGATLTEEQTALRWVLQSDDTVAVKVFLSPTDVKYWIKSPFRMLRGAARANVKPTLTTLRDFSGEPDPLGPPGPVLPATTVFKPEDILAKAATDFQGNCAEDRELVALLYRRIMGPTYQVFWPESGPQLGHLGDARGIPLCFASAGECVVFAYAAFLARTARTVTPGMSLGLYLVFNAMDMLRQVAAFDCLRQFVVATGTSVVVQSARSEVRNLARLRMDDGFSALVSTEGQALVGYC